MTATVPAWLALAEYDIGVLEQPGDDDHPRIREYHSYTAGGEAPDEVPWCASAMCCWLEEAGYRSPRSKRASSFLTWGRELQGPAIGCLVVFKRKGGYHVAMVQRIDGDTLYCLGGNQSNQVVTQPRRTRDVLTYRWPANAL